MDSNHETVPLHHSEKADAEVPLLGDQLKHPDCPGCKNAHLQAKGSGPPIKLLLMLSSVVLCNAIPISSLYPFLYFMVEDFHIAKTSEDIGYYAGAVGSVFMVGRVISSVPWGMFADKYGRRTVFYSGLVSIIILQPVFGLSSNFWVAFTARFLLGLFNGMLGPLKAYSGEICNAENQAWGLTAVSTSWSLGLIIGPALGGFLARPAINYPQYVSPDSLFGRFPYLLPSVVNVIYAFFELLVVYYLPETIHKHDEAETEDVEENAIEAATGHPEKPSLWSSWPLMASVAVYCVWSLHEIAFTEVFSMWCVSPLENGGLSLTTSDVGIIMSISGFGMVFVQLAAFPPLASYFGPILVTRIPAILAIPIVILFPFVGALSSSLQWLLVNVLALVRNIFSAMVVTGSFLLVNNAVPTEERGAANGISLSCVSVFRAIGPAVAGAVFSWGQSRHNATILPGSQIVFFILDAVCVASVFTICPPFLPKQVDIQYTEWVALQNAKSESEAIEGKDEGDGELTKDH